MSRVKKLTGRQNSEAVNESTASLDGSKQRSGGLRGLLSSARSLGRKRGGGEGSRGEDDQVNLTMLRYHPIYLYLLAVNVLMVPLGFAWFRFMWDTFHGINQQKRSEFHCAEDQRDGCIRHTYCSIINTPSPVHLRAKRAMSARSLFCPVDLSLSLRRGPTPLGGADNRVVWGRRVPPKCAGDG